MHLINKSRNFTRREARIKALSHLVGHSLFKLLKFCPAICALLLTACASTEKEVEPPEYTHINQIQRFEARGKVAVITPQQRESVNFNWQQDGEQYQVSFTTFLGIEVAHLSGSHKTIKIVADGKEYESSQPELLLKEVTGWHIPIRHLSQWLTGRARGVVMTTHEGSNKPKKILARISAQEEWTINYPQFQQVHKLQLPKKIQLKQFGSKINLSINKWILN